MSKTTWVTAAALQALAAQPSTIQAGDSFTAGQLADWTKGTLTHEQRVHASSRLCSAGFVRHCPQVIDGDRVDVYVITPEGDAAIDAARAGHRHKSGPKATRGPQEPNPADFSYRLWQLLRVRKMLTPLEAAQTLCDAGDDTDFERKRATARKCLRRWCNAGALAESARRVGAGGQSNGDKRYVLLVDGLTPPRWLKPSTKAERTVHRAARATPAAPASAKRASA